MRKLLLLAALAAAAPLSANAATWIAVCNDGNHVQYNQVPGAAGQLYFSNAMTHGLQIAALTGTTSSATMVCGAVNANPPPGLTPPLSQLCIDKTTNTITMKWHNPTIPGGTAVDQGKFCTATIKIS